MAYRDFILPQRELEDIAEFLKDEMKGVPGSAVSRYNRASAESTIFQNGLKLQGESVTESLNLELIEQGEYRHMSGGGGSINKLTFPFFSGVRDTETHRFHFQPKGIALPVAEQKYIRSIPTGLERFDAELAEFTRLSPLSGITRYFIVDQRVQVNSVGGITIESTPSLIISYCRNTFPVMTRRDIAAVCTTEEEFCKFPSLLKYMADPTPDKRIRRARSFGEAFSHLDAISSIKYGSLEEAGIQSRLADLVVLNGVPVHEVFGHHFEEPVEMIPFGTIPPFKCRQKMDNTSITMLDNPLQEVEGLQVYGSRSIDAYGRLAAKTTHICDGEVKGFLGSEYGDSKHLEKNWDIQKSSFFGNARQTLNGSFPQARMSCTVLEGRAEDIPLEGKIILVPSEGHTNSHDQTYMVEASECYVVRDGEPQRLIPLRMTGGIHQALAHLVLLPTLTYNSGMCGKAEPLYRKEQNMIPVSEFCLDQLWQQQQIMPIPIQERHLEILRRF